MQSDAELLAAIFSDGCVIDIDLSEWHDHIRLYAIGSNMKPEGGRLPIFEISFEHPTRFEIQMMPRPTEIPPPIVWRTWQATCETLGSGETCVVISGLGPDPSPAVTEPVVKVVCDGFLISSVPSRWFDRIEPKWAKPGSRSFVRPGPIALSKHVQQLARE